MDALALFLTIAGAVGLVVISWRAGRRYERMNLAKKLGHDLSDYSYKQIEAELKNHFRRKLDASVKRILATQPGNATKH